MFIRKNLIVGKPNNRSRLDNSERQRENCKDSDFCIGDWNVHSMYRTGMLKQSWKSIEINSSNARDKMEENWSVGYREIHVDVQW